MKWSHHVSELLLLPANTTELWQALDRLFKGWHSAYIDEVDMWKKTHAGVAVGRATFVSCFEKAWPRWVEPHEIKAAFRQVGWALDAPGVNRDLFPDDHKLFKIAASLRVSQLH